MKANKLLNAIGSISDKHIEEAAPGRNASNKQQAFSSKRRFLRYAAVAACAVVFIFATTAFAASYIQNSISVFYMRYLSPEEMAVADSMAEQYGAKVYFDGLKSDDVNKQYFSISKLVEYYNDENVRQEAIRAITPFLSPETLEDENADPGKRALADAAAFALSVLKAEFDDPRIVHMADGTIIFTLFNGYSDYGTYNQIWMVKDGELRVLASFDRPKMYITQIVPSPDKRLFAVSFVSNKSSYLMIWDLENNRVSSELIDSVRVMVAKDLDITYWQRIDNENYSDIRGTWDDVMGIESDDILWTDNGAIEFTSSLWYPGTGDGDATFIREVFVRYDFREEHMEYEIIEDGITANEAVEQLIGSLQFTDNDISFQIPPQYYKPHDWNIHISGRAEFEDGMSKSVHYFEDENERHVWEAGKWYSIALENRNLTELAMDIYLTDENGNVIEKSVDLLAAAQDAYFEVLVRDRELSDEIDIAVGDQGDYEKTAYTWLNAWLESYKSMPTDGLAHIEDGDIDSLELLMTSKEGLPKAVIFSSRVSVKPTYTIGRNSFWMAGNTGSSPDRDESWGQFYREFELRQESDGEFHLVCSGTGAVWGTTRYDEYDMFDSVSYSEVKKPENMQQQGTVTENGTPSVAFKYTVIRRDIDFDLYEEYNLSDSEAEELDKLLQKEQWEIAVDLPIMGYVDGEGYDSVTLRDEDRNTAFVVKEKLEDKWVTLIIYKNASDTDSSANYTAPVDVILNVMQFTQRIKQEQRVDSDTPSDVFDASDYYQIIKHDLIKHPELIPCEGSLGGTMDFYSESDIFVTYKYAFAVAEDGHTSVYMLFEYDIDSEDVITWKLIGYDIGAQGFCLVNNQ